MSEQNCHEFRTHGKQMLELYTQSNRDQAGKIKSLALGLYKNMNLQEQEESLMWLEKRIAIYPEQIGSLLELISDLYQYHCQERIFLSTSNLFFRTGLLLAARPEFRLM